MIHLTLNTGHRRESPRSEVCDDVLPIVRPWLTPGEHDLVMPGNCRLNVPIVEHGWIGTLYSGDAQLVTIGIAADESQADQVWPTLESLYLGLTDESPLATTNGQLSNRPTSTPWVAAVIVSPMKTIAQMIHDLERCLAWAWLESRAIEPVAV